MCNSYSCGPCGGGSCGPAKGMFSKENALEALEKKEKNLEEALKFVRREKDALRADLAAKK